VLIGPAIEGLRKQRPALTSGSAAVVSPLQIRHTLAAEACGSQVLPKRREFRMVSTVAFFPQAQLNDIAK
jgi:hypothetical protein